MNKRDEFLDLVESYKTPVFSPWAAVYFAVECVIYKHEKELEHIEMMSRMAKPPVRRV